MFDYDAIMQRLQAIPNFKIDQISHTGDVIPYKIEDMNVLLNELVIRTDSVDVQQELLPAQIGHWGRISALAERVRQIRAREYRVWRDRKLLELLTPPGPGEVKEGWGVTAKQEPKPPTQTVVDAMIRNHPEYVEKQKAEEEAAEAEAIAKSIQEAFRQKAQLIKNRPINPLY